MRGPMAPPSASPRRPPPLSGQRPFLAPSSSLLWGFLFIGFLPWQKLAALVGGGMLAGWIGSGLSVRESSAEQAERNMDKVQRRDGELIVVIPGNGAKAGGRGEGRVVILRRAFSPDPDGRPAGGS